MRKLLKERCFIVWAIVFIVIMYGPVFAYGLYMSRDDSAEVGL